MILLGMLLSACGGGGDGGGGDTVTDNPPVISQVGSSVFSDTDNVYPTGRVVRIDVEESSGATHIDSGTIRITSASQGYDSGIQDLTFGSIFYHWDTTDVNPASDYIVKVAITDDAGQTTTDDSLVITLAPNPPAINKLVSEVDISVPAQGLPVRVVRTYLLDSGFDSTLGFGWTHTYLMHVVETGDGLVKVFNADGSGSFFERNGDGTYDPPKGDFRTLSKASDGTFELKGKSGTRFHFSAAGMLASVEDRNGNTVTLVYDTQGFLETITDASGQITTFSYDANNRIASITDPAGRCVSYGYDNTGNLISVTNIGGFETIYAYDTDHNLTTVTDPAGRQTFYTINADDWIETVSGAGGENSLTFQYGVPMANQMTVTDALGNQTILTYDNNASITSITDPSGNTTSMTYDTDLNLTSRTDATGNQTNLTYDTQGNVLTATDAQGNTVTLTYEPLFNQVTSLIDANGNTTSFGYDASGNLITRGYPNGNTENFSYDTYGKLSNLTDSNGNTTTFDYDTNGNLTTMTYPDGSAEMVTYDAFWNLNSKIDRKNQIINYTYDLSGRLITKLYPNNSSDSFVYDSTGKLLSATDENGVISFSYDSLGRIAQVTYPGGGVVSYGYDATSNRTRLTYPDGMVLDYDYDSLNRLTQINNSGQMVAGYTYDQLSRVIRRELQNGTFSTYSYDPSNRLLELINSKSTSEVISSFVYTYDNVGNRLTMTTLDGLTQYAYDAIHQLTNVIYPDGSTTSYNLDPAGNRLSEVVDGNSIDYTTNNLNQYTDVNGDSYTYDANGNMTSKTTPSGTTIYTYDFENRLIQVDTVTETISYTYDPFGRRTSKTTASGTTRYIHDGFRVIMEKDDSDTIEAAYIHGIWIDEVLVMKRGGVDYFYSQDGLGSVSDITDLSENTDESFAYDAYGLPSNVSSVGNPYLFTGREYEPETGLYYYRARYYDPEIGRFLAEDPIGFYGGDFNLNSYVRNNPTNLIDPSGLAWIGRTKPGVFLWHRHIFFDKPVTINGHEYNDIGFAHGGFPFGGPGGILWGQDSNNYNTEISDLDDNVIAQAIAEVGEPNYFPGIYDCRHWIDDVLKIYGQLKDGDGSLSTGDPTFIQTSKKESIHNKPISNSKNLIANIAVPHEASLVRANAPIFGQAYGKAFKEYRVEYGAGKNPSEWFHIYTSTKPQTKKITPEDLDDSLDLTIYGNLATWDTGLKNYVYLPSHPKDHPINLKGTYTIRLVVTGNDGSMAEDRVTVDVANVIPNAWGGQATSKDERVVLFVPEQAIMDSFRLILIEAAKNERVGSQSERQIIGNIYEVREPGEQFTKAALLHMAYHKEKVGNTRLSQLGIYGYNSKTKKWEYLDSTRDEHANVVFAKVRKLHTYYALMTSEVTGEGSVEASVSQKRSHIQQANTIPGYGHTLVRNTFEESLGDWSNRDNEVGASVTLDNTATFDETHAIKITNTHVAGNFAVNVITTPFDVREYPLVQFDYRIPPEVKTNFLVKVSGRWYDIGFTDELKELNDKRVNIAHIGDINNVVADDQWHTTRFNLYDMLKTKTGNTHAEAIIMADWDVGGYMKLQFGKNAKDATYYIDNFSISREVTAGLKLNTDTILVDNFNQKKEANAIGGTISTFSDGEIEHLKIDFSEVDAVGIGHSLEISYELPQKKSYTCYISELRNLDLRGYQTLTFFIKGTENYQDLLVGLKDDSGNESKVLASNYLPEKITTEWQRVTFPLVSFSNIKDWGRLENFSLSFENSLHSKGVVFIDNVEFHKGTRTYLVDNFERPDKKNSLGRKHYTFVNGAAAINGQHAKGSPNGIYRISYGGNIGAIKAYASDLKSFAGWATELGGMNCSQCGTLSFRIKGAEGGENPSIYLDDGNFRWGLEIANYASVTNSWQEVSIPISEFSEYGVDLTHLAKLQFVLEGVKMSGTIYLDDIRFGPPEQ
jgi:RHS repeat-associated protein